MEAMYFTKRNVMFNDLNTATLKTSTSTTPTPNKSTQLNGQYNSKHNNQRTAVLSSKTKTSQLIQNHLAKQNNQSVKTDTIFKQSLQNDINQSMKSNSFNVYNNNYTNSGSFSPNKRFLNRPVTPSTFYNNKINKSSKENVNTSTETINIINNKKKNSPQLNTNNQIITHLLNNSLINENSPSYMAFNNKSEISVVHDNNQNSINHFNHTQPKIKSDELKNMQNTFIQINRLTENHIKLKEQILNHYLNTSTSNQFKHNNDDNFKNNSINNPANFESKSTLMDYQSKLRLANNNSNNSSYTKFISNSMNKPKTGINSGTKKLSPTLKLNNKEYSFNLKSTHSNNNNSNNNSSNQTNQFFNQFINKTTNSENQFRRSSLETSLEEKNRQSALISKLNNQTNNEKQSVTVDLVKNLNKNGEANSNLVNNKSESRASNRNVNNNALVVNYLSNKLINNRTSPKTHLQIPTNNNNISINTTSNNVQQKYISTTPSNKQAAIDQEPIKIQESNNIIQTKEYLNNIERNDHDGDDDKIDFDINQISYNKNFQMTLDKESLLLLEQINKKCNEWLDKHVMPFIYINTSSSVSIDSSSSFEDESKHFK